MLVKNGHGIILKTIMGRIPAAVTHMSFGSSYPSGANVTNTFARENMGFEVVRIPVQVAFDHLTSQTNQPVVGKEDFQLVYKGEIPTNRRVSFNEIGLWCGSSNIRYGDAGGVLLSSVESSEHWLLKEYNDTEQISQSIIAEQDFFRAIQAPYYDIPGMKPAQPRIGNTALPLQALKNSPPHEVYELTTNVDLSQYNPQDLIKFAVTWTPAKTGMDSIPGTFNSVWFLNIIFNFSSNDPALATKVVPVQFSALWNTASSQMNTYKVIPIELADLTDASRGILKSIGIRVVRRGPISGYPTPPTTSQVLLDGIRIDRSINNNPLYGLVFYDYVSRTVVVDGNEYEIPIEKMSGFDGHLEHRVRMFANATGEAAV